MPFKYFQILFRNDIIGVCEIKYSKFGDIVSYDFIDNISKHYDNLHNINIELLTENGIRLKDFIIVLNICE